jgi:hypothetical protein
MRRSDSAGFDRLLAQCNYPAGCFLDHLFQLHSQMRVRQVIRRGDVLDAIDMG